MSTNPTESKPSESPDPRPTRPWTILGRLSEAVREQNWFAVVLEVVIVIVGVVIGFQVTAWGQNHADRAKEQTYLRQLVEDLRESERLVAQTDRSLRATTRATYMLHRSFYEPIPPPPDSILRWITLADYARTVRPVMGTTTALISTGDMNLIRNGDLRTAITAYADEMARTDGVQQAALEWRTEAMLVVLAQVDAADLAEEASRAFPGGYFPDSVLTMMIPQGERRQPFPLDREAFLSSREANGAVFQMVDRSAHLALYRTQIAERSAALRELVEAELDR